jgi:hypothetical protein
METKGSSETKGNSATVERPVQGSAVYTSRSTRRLECCKPESDRSSFEPNRSSPMVWLDRWTSPQWPVMRPVDSPDKSNTDYIPRLRPIPSLMEPPIQKLEEFHRLATCRLVSFEAWVVAVDNCRRVLSAPKLERVESNTGMKCTAPWLRLELPCWDQWSAMGGSKSLGLAERCCCSSAHSSSAEAMRSVATHLEASQLVEEWPQQFRLASARCNQPHSVQSQVTVYRSNFPCSLRNQSSAHNRPKAHIQRHIAQQDIAVRCIERLDTGLLDIDQLAAFEHIRLLDILLCNQGNPLHNQDNQRRSRGILQRSHSPAGLAHLLDRKVASVDRETANR